MKRTFESNNKNEYYPTSLLQEKVWSCDQTTARTFVFQRVVFFRCNLIA